MFCKIKDEWRGPRNKSDDKIAYLVLTTKLKNLVRCNNELKRLIDPNLPVEEKVSSIRDKNTNWKISSIRRETEFVSKKVIADLSFEVSKLEHENVRLKEKLKSSTNKVAGDFFFSVFLIPCSIYVIIIQIVPLNVLFLQGRD